MNREPRPTAGTIFLGLAAVLTAAYWVITTLAFHLVRSDLDPCCTTLDSYTTGTWEWWAQSAFVVFGLGWMAAAISLHRTLIDLRGAGFAGLSAGLLGVSLIGLGIFPTNGTDTPIAATLHDISSWVLPAAALLLAFTGAWTMRAIPTWRPLAWTSLALGLSSSALVAALTIAPDTFVDTAGWWQRTALIVLLPAWLTLLGQRLARTRTPAPTPQAPAHL